jgi:hypothetical protein
MYCLEEVVWRTSTDHGFAGSWAGVELQAVANGQSDFQRVSLFSTHNVYFRCSSISIIAA